MPLRVVVTSAPSVNSGSAAVTVTTAKPWIHRGVESVPAAGVVGVIREFSVRPGGSSHRTGSMLVALVPLLVLRAELGPLGQVVAVLPKVPVLVRPAVHDRLHVEIAVRGRRRRGPLQR